MGSVMIEENVVRAAGAAYCMDEVEIVRNIENAGFVAKRRNMHYDILGDPYLPRAGRCRGSSSWRRRAPTATPRAPRSCDSTPHAPRRKSASAPQTPSATDEHR